jgi:hypothetical protein
MPGTNDDAVKRRYGIIGWDTKRCNHSNSYWINVISQTIRRQHVMNHINLFAAFFALTAVSTASAGVLENGSWSASGCGAMPETPVIDSSSADAFNRSVGAINAWQKKMQAYHDCKIKEANADSLTINQAATAGQGRINGIVEKINAEVAAGKQKVEKSQSAFPSLSPPPGAAPGSLAY